MDAYLTFLSPHCHLGRVTVGMPFEWREGGRTVGTGIVQEVLGLEASAAEALKQEAFRDVRAAFERLAAAAKALDTEAYFSHFDKDAFVGLNSDGRNWNDFSAFETVVTGGFAALARVDELVFVNVKISVLDASNAVLVNEYEQSVTLKSGATMDLAGGGTQVWSKRSGQWKLVSVSASNRSGLP